MRITITIRTYLAKGIHHEERATAIGHPAGDSWRWYPHVIIPFEPQVGRTHADVVELVKPLESLPFELDVPDWFFEEELRMEARVLVLDAVREAVRRIC